MNAPPESGAILYCSSVSPQAAVAGELLVHRHLSRLQGRPLMVMSPEEKPPTALDQMVEQVSIRRGSIWVWRFRRGWTFPLADRLLAARIVRRLDEMAARTKPAVVITTFLPDVFLTAAAAFARRRQLPLVLICHDDYEDTTPRSFHRQLAAIYRQADVRLCVSAVMADEFEKRYGAKGEVLYPIPSGPAKLPVMGEEGPPRIGFAGTVGAGYEEALVRLADAVGSVGGQIVVASPTLRSLVQRFWAHPAVRDLGRLPPDKVAHAMQQAGVNVLAVVQSFDPRDERAFRVNFPSKLTEYATFGLPLLIVAPPSASAARWAGTRGEEVAVFSTDSPADLQGAVHRLADPAARFRLAQGFYRASAEFAPERLQSLFAAAIESAIAAANSRPTGS